MLEKSNFSHLAVEKKNISRIFFVGLGDLEPDFSKGHENDCKPRIISKNTCNNYLLQKLYNCNN